MRLEWKVFISSKPCRLIVVPRQEFIKHMFGELLFFFVFPKLGISYKAKKDEPLPYAGSSCTNNTLSDQGYARCFLIFQEYFCTLRIRCMLFSDR